jgi:hypothetical protein
VGLADGDQSGALERSIHPSSSSFLLSACHARTHTLSVGTPFSGKGELDDGGSCPRKRRTNLPPAGIKKGISGDFGLHLSGFSICLCTDVKGKMM